MPLDPLTHCAACGADASMRCPNCLDAPEYQNGDSNVVVYCDDFCQETHWPKHMGYCKDMQKRKRLLRAARILKAAVLTYKEIVYDLDLTKIEFNDGALFLHHKPRSISSGPKRGPFPDQITENIEHKQAALLKNQSTTAMALLGPLTRKLLPDMSFIIDTMDLIIRNPPVPTKLIPDFDPYGDVHTVLRIQEPGDNDTWIIDTTGCQYGYRDLLIPFDKYFMGKDFELLASPLPYNASETKDLDYYALVPCFTMSKAQRIGIRKERHTRHRFAAFVAKAVGDKFLEGSDAEFEETIDRFVDQLKTHMLSSIKATEHLTFDSDEEWNFSKIAR